MNRWSRWKPRNSTLWRTAAAFWILNAASNGVTACVARTPSVYLALSGINVFLAGLSYFVGSQYRQAEASLDAMSADQRSSAPSRLSVDSSAE